MDARIVAAEAAFTPYRYRTPMKFGGRVVTEVTLLEVRLTVESRAGARATGLGAMPLGHTWAVPASRLAPEAALAAMRHLAQRGARDCTELGVSGHAIDLGLALEECFLAKASGALPKLAVLVTGSAFDAAVHDAYAHLHGLHPYQIYGPELLPHDLSRYLGKYGRGRHLQEFIARRPAERIPLYHCVGALDPLTDADVREPVGDGLPETLAQWISREGLTHFKIKLAGNDLAWDRERIAAVDRLAQAGGAGAIFHSLDFNEACTSVDYLVEFLERLRADAPAAFARVQLIEQPFPRDQFADPARRVHAAAALRPIVIDESLTDLASLRLACDAGYTGVALKACKGQTQSLLTAAASREHRLFLCVQDLTCPGRALLQSARLAAYLPGIAGIEANARQYVPAANDAWVERNRYPGLFRAEAGALRTASV